ncbi:MAG: hypothetical protein ACI9TP_000639 [Candidatus Azotimanducaceae bacterium]|jgi:hypothetical protein
MNTAILRKYTLIDAIIFGRVSAYVTLVIFLLASRRLLPCVAAIDPAISIESGACRLFSKTHSATIDNPSETQLIHIDFHTILRQVQEEVQRKSSGHPRSPHGKNSDLWVIVLHSSLRRLLESNSSDSLQATRPRAGTLVKSPLRHSASSRNLY